MYHQLIILGSHAADGCFHRRPNNYNQLRMHSDTIRKMDFGARFRPQLLLRVLCNLEILRFKGND